MLYSPWKYRLHTLTVSCSITELNFAQIIYNNDNFYNNIRNSANTHYAVVLAHYRYNELSKMDFTNMIFLVILTGHSMTKTSVFPKIELV